MSRRRLTAQLGWHPALLITAASPKTPSRRLHLLRKHQLSLAVISASLALPRDILPQAREVPAAFVLHYPGHTRHSLSSPGLKMSPSLRPQIASLARAILRSPAEHQTKQRPPVAMYIHAEDPALGRRFAREMANYREEPKGSYCPMCMDLDGLKTPPRNRGGRVPGHVSLQTRSILEFRKAGDAGCPICAMICQASERLFSPAEANQIGVGISIQFPTITIRFARPREHRGDELPDEYQLYTPTSSIGGGRLPTMFLKGRDVAKESGSAACLAFAKSCLEDCIERHHVCRTGAAVSITPTRLVYVGLNNSEIKLVELARGTVTPFAALSYCWGKAVPITTESKTIAARKAGLEWDCLPPVLQDAMTVTRYLGLQYVWIDALCIIQDSKEDWQIESSRMADIYQGSVVTIAASSSDSCAVPFLKSRPEGGTAYPMALQVDGKDGQPYSLNLRKPAPPHYTDGEPLNTRSWTYQERVLSSRILHYTANELVWECRRGIRCECQAHDDPPVTPGRPEAASSDDEKVMTRKHSTDPRTGDPLLAWEGGLGYYTRRNLTYQSDRLPALSGIASVVQQRTGWTYLAGLWREDLLNDLQWDVLDYDFHNRRALDTYRAPTFSWASLEVSSRYPYHENAASFKCKTEILDANCVPDGLNPLGAVKDGFAKVEGPVLQQLLSCPDLTDPRCCSIDFPKPKSYRWDDLSISLDVPLGKDLENGRNTVRRLLPGENFKPFQGPILVLLLGNKIDGIPVGLILGESARVSQAYERLGISYLTYYRDDLKFIYRRAEKKAITLV